MESNSWDSARKPSLVHAHAIKSVSRGWPVHPIKAGRKRPASLNGFKDGTLDPDQVDQWFKNSHFNLGIRTGQISKIVVLDADLYREDCGWAALVAELGRLPETYRVVTRAGGEHFYFIYPDGCEIKSSQGVVVTGVDVRSDGGYVVGPGSYVRADDKGPAGFYVLENDLPVAQLPEPWLQRLINSNKSTLKLRKTGQPETPLGLSIRSTFKPLYTIPEQLLEGQRAVGFLKMAGHLRSRGVDQTEIERYCLEFNEKKCRPPLAKDELLTQVGRYKNEGGEGIYDGDGGDLANADFFSYLFRGHLAYLREIDIWLEFDIQAGWRQSAIDSEYQRARSALFELKRLAAQEFIQDHQSAVCKRMLNAVKKLGTKPGIDNMINLAKTDNLLSFSSLDFDLDSFSMGVSNGVLDLKTKSLIKLRPSVLVMKRTNFAFDPKANCPQFLNFLKEVIPSVQQRNFLQRWFGYCLSGSTQEQQSLFLIGPGRNGKSVLLELMSELLGDYSKKIQTEMLMRQYRSTQAASPDIAGLQGCRLVFCNETEEGRHLDSARLKELAGGDTLVGRVPYAKKEISFKPNLKLVIAGNHLPIVADNSLGFWRRVILLRMTVTIPEDKVDKSLFEKLRAEGSGILNWCLAGFEQWQKGGLKVPEDLIAETSVYRKDQDILVDWLEDRCDISDEFSESKALLYGSYQFWCQLNGYKPLSKKRLSRQLTERGFTTEKDNRTMTGLQLADQRKRMFPGNI